MSSQTLTATGLLRFIVVCVAISSLSALLFLAFRHNANVAGPAGGLGISAAFLGSGVAAYYCLRARSCGFVFVAVASLFPLAFWCWLLYQILHPAA